MKINRKMAVQSDQCENSEIYYTVDDFTILTVTTSTNKIQMKNRNSVARMRYPNESGSGSVKIN